MREGFPPVEGVCLNRVANLYCRLCRVVSSVLRRASISKLGVACWTNNDVVVDRFNGGRRHSSHNRQERKKEEVQGLSSVQIILLLPVAS